jgi:hypothetical protein
MSWQLFKTIYEAASDITIGGDKLGFVQRTRYYIPARSLWGAATANLTQQLNAKPCAYDYQKTGNQLLDDCRFSYLYLTDSHKTVMPWPVTTTDAISGLDPEEFEQCYVYSRTRTAVAPGTSTAEDSALFEFEFLRSRNDDGLHIMWTGYVWLRDSENLSPEQLRKALSRIQVGGERHYGAGQLLLREWTELPSASAEIFGVTSTCDESGPKLQLVDDKPVHLPAHLAIKGLNIDVSGEFELLQGRVWTDTKPVQGPGRTVEPFGGLCWMPGAVPKVSQTVSLTIDGYGILRSVAG